MKKRFFDADIWEDHWFMALPQKTKLLWLFMLSKCDLAGIWEPNWKLASFVIGQEVGLADLEEIGEEKAIWLDNGKLLLRKFIRFQNGILSEKCPTHKKILSLLSANGIELDSIGHAYPSNRVSILREREYKYKKKEKKKTSEEGDARGRSRQISRRPADKAEFMAHCDRIGIPEPDADQLYADNEACDWTCGDGPITNWRRMCIYARDKIRQKNNGQLLPPSKQLEILQREINRHPCCPDAKRHIRNPSPELKAGYQALLDRKEQLEKQGAGL